MYGEYVLFLLSFYSLLFHPLSFTFLFSTAPLYLICLKCDCNYILHYHYLQKKVAMTRSKRHLCVVGDSETLSKKDVFLKAWMDFLGEHAEVRYLE